LVGFLEIVWSKVELLGLELGILFEYKLLTVVGHLFSLSSVSPKLKLDFVRSGEIFDDKVGMGSVEVDFVVVGASCVGVVVRIVLAVGVNEIGGAVAVIVVLVYAILFSPLWKVEQC